MFLVRIGMPLVRVADVFDENTVAVGEGTDAGREATAVQEL